jgi:hypothetical protein
MPMPAAAPSHEADVIELSRPPSGESGAGRPNQVRHGSGGGRRPPDQQVFGGVERAVFAQKPVTR